MKILFTLFMLLLTINICQSQNIPELIKDTPIKYEYIELVEMNKGVGLMGKRKFNVRNGTFDGNRFEYAMDEFTDVKIELYATALNFLGESGWEVVSIYEDQGRRITLMKRKVEK